MKQFLKISLRRIWPNKPLIFFYQVYKYEFYPTFLYWSQKFDGQFIITCMLNAN